MRRGDIVTVAASGDYGKPRPAVILTSDTLLESDHDAVVVCQFTSTIDSSSAFRVTVDPAPENGLSLQSDLMADRPVAVIRRRIGPTIGRLNDTDIQRLNMALAFALGL